MAIPKFIGQGAGVQGTGNLSVAYPGSIQAGDLIVLQIVCRDTTSTATATNNFSILYGPDANTTGRQFLFAKIADGTETGSITVNIAGTVSHGARMYLFRGTRTTGFAEGGAVQAGTGASIEHPNVTTSASERLIVAFTYVTDDNAIPQFGSASGGVWTEGPEYLISAGTDGEIQLQYASVTGTTTLASGTATMAAADPWVVRAFALTPPVVATYDNTATFQAAMSIMASGFTGYPVADETDTIFDSEVTTHTADYPPIVNSGDGLLLVICVGYGGGTISVPTGYDATNKFDAVYSDAVRLAGFVRVADGTEGGSTIDVVTSDASQAVVRIFRIQNWFGAVSGVAFGTAVTSAGSFNADPPNLSASWGSAKNLFIALTGIDDVFSVVSAYPSLYFGGLFAQSTVAGSPCGLGSAKKHSESAAENPDAFVLTSDGYAWIANAVAIRPPAAPSYDNTASYAANAYLSAVGNLVMAEVGSFMAKAGIASLGTITYPAIINLPATANMAADAVLVQSGFVQLGANAALAISEALIARESITQPVLAGLDASASIALVVVMESASFTTLLDMGVATIATFEPSMELPAVAGMAAFASLSGVAEGVLQGTPIREYQTVLGKRRHGKHIYGPDWQALASASAAVQAAIPNTLLADSPLAGALPVAKPDRLATVQTVPKPKTAKVKAPSKSQVAILDQEADDEEALLYILMLAA